MGKILNMKNNSSFEIFQQQNISLLFLFPSATTICFSGEYIFNIRSDFCASDVFSSTPHANGLRSQHKYK